MLMIGEALVFLQQKNRKKTTTTNIQTRKCLNRLTTMMNIDAAGCVKCENIGSVGVFVCDEMSEGK